MDLLVPTDTGLMLHNTRHRSNTNNRSSGYGSSSSSATNSSEFLVQQDAHANADPVMTNIPAPLRNRDVVMANSNSNSRKYNNIHPWNGMRLFLKKKYSGNSNKFHYLDLEEDEEEEEIPVPKLKRLKLQDDDDSSFAFQSPSRQCLQRIHHDLSHLYSDPIDGIFVVPDNAKANCCHAILLGPPDSPYEFGFFYFVLEFPNHYPHAPPRVLFQSSTATSSAADGNSQQHNETNRFCPPNLGVDANGRLCLGILGTGRDGVGGGSWSPALSLGSVLLSIQSLLNDPPHPDNSVGFGATTSHLNVTRQEDEHPEESSHHSHSHHDHHHYHHTISLRHETMRVALRHETIRVAVLGMVQRALANQLPAKLAELVLDTYQATSECCQYMCDEYSTLLDGQPMDSYSSFFIGNHHHPLTNSDSLHNNNNSTNRTIFHFAKLKQELRAMEHTVAAVLQHQHQQRVDVQDDLMN